VWDAVRPEPGTARQRNLFWFLSRSVERAEAGSGGNRTGSGWSLYSSAQVSRWFAEHYGTEAGSTYDREIAAADHLVRARRMLAGNENRAELAKLLSA
jgi:hypothetical protein